MGTEKNLPVDNNKLNDINITQPNQSEPITQIQKDSVITSEDLPDPRLIGLVLVILAAFLFVAAIYYGIINP